MSFDDARALWRAQEGGPSRKVTEDALLRAVKGEAKSFDRMIRMRDWRETIVAGIVLLLFIPALFSSCQLTQAGAALVIIGCLTTIVRLEQTRRRHGTPDPSQPLAEVVRAERDKVEAQIGLLRSVFWWAILPISAGVVLVVGCGSWGVRWVQAYVGGVGALAWVIWYVNQLAVRRALEPRRDQLTRTLAEIEQPDSPADEGPARDTGSASDADTEPNGDRLT